MSTATDSETFTAVGRRKTAVARIRLSRGEGKLTVNGRPLENYFFTEMLAKRATRPLDVAELAGQMDATFLVEGGGSVSQAGAVSHALARALQKYNPELRPALKKAGLITRDPRMKERKKSGQPGARKRFQFSKR
ncbi:30S ribosomal protein S9 [Ruficoccus amylovorans]|uniref:Small ribosomal subunit protein uS9 n=1 Tax=Ruficoccus amylovorans TaxID=1804625 RepID=A0A842HKG4_9BACT|nr:30S ribosomal protein S9 [Ruficoccus amylovorans]MBC2596438.1 30S ribosomal protein S9 [Ruficoccus amylovorans]